jgi:uncharacterized protein
MTDVDPTGSDPVAAPPVPGAAARDRNADGRPENARPRDRFGAPLPRDAVDEMPDRVEPEDVCRTVDDAVEGARRCMDDGRYFEAHEFFEWAWKGPVTDDRDRPFFKGMAQLAVGCTHTQRGNGRGAVSLLERGIGQLTSFGPVHHGIDVPRAIADARRLLTVLETTDPGPDLDLPPFPAA